MLKSHFLSHRILMSHCILMMADCTLGKKKKKKGSSKCDRRHKLLHILGELKHRV